MPNPYVGSNIAGCNSPGLGVDKTNYSAVLDLLAAALDAHDHSSNKGLPVDTSGLADLSVTTGKIAAAAVDASKLAASIAGAGLTGGAGTALSVVVDGTTIEIATDTLQVKAGGIGTTQIADLAVSTAKIAAGAVTLGKVASEVSDYFVPVGTVFDHAGTAAPPGYLLCYGQAVSRTTYASLFGIIGTVYGVGDGSTTFNIPDLRGRVSAGKDNMGGSTASRITFTGSGIVGTTLGAAGGAEGVALVEGQLAAHTHVIANHSHSITDPGHFHNYSSAQGAGQGSPGGDPSTIYYGGNVSNTTGNKATGITGTNAASLTANVTGSGAEHVNVQPTLVLNKIIRAL